MTKVAVLITVFNRRDTTLKGLRSLKASIAALGNDFNFDIFLTDDGCTDGTADAVRQEYPDVNIVIGNGSLFWGGGMNMAWHKAVESNENYDYFLWYNDDSNIFPNALNILFEKTSNDIVVTGAFKDHDGIVSYGGKTINDQLITPNGTYQEVVKMNGNLVLIPYSIFKDVGFIDKHFIHGGGDFDYGYRVIEKGYKVVLTPKYVGISDRHGDFLPKYCNKELPLNKRWSILHNPMNSPKIYFRYNKKREGIFKALFYYIISYVGVLSPKLYEYVKNKYKR